MAGIQTRVHPNDVRAVIVPRLESEVVTGEVSTGPGSFLRQVNFTIPFDEVGQVDLNFAPAAQE
ncbi:MAG: hypothetical protein H0X47_01215 [Nitrospirales bacterium]|nr:hypothetical protein [Nitrospirales bacterium]